VSIMDARIVYLLSMAVSGMDKVAQLNIPIVKQEIGAVIHLAIILNAIISMEEESEGVKTVISFLPLN
jgi:hypothetical protein